MTIKLDDNKNFIHIIDATKIELAQLKYSFTKKVANWFIIKKKNPSWDGEIKFIDTLNRIPIGLWKELIVLCKEYNFELNIVGGPSQFVNEKFNEADFKSWVKEYFFHENSKIKPYDYQIEGAMKALKFKRCLEEISTSGGKTFILFMIFQYLFDRGFTKHTLMIVPNLGLISQAEEDFYDYIDKSGHKPNWKSECVFGGSKKTESPTGNIIFGTYQSLVKKDESYFKDIDSVFIDECHHANSSSIRKIILNCFNANVKLGFSGTLPKADTCESFTIQSYIGPCVFTLTSAALIQDKKATPIHVECYELDYLPADTKKKLCELRCNKREGEGTKLLNLERNVMRENRDRLVFICNKVIEQKNNSLVLFSDVQGQYGRNIFKYLKENSEYDVYYIDGSTPDTNRSYIKKQMEDNTNVIIVASMGTFSEGISVKNLHSIFLAECGKSEIIAAQILGRGMRLHSSKDKVIIFDFIDNYVYGNSKQYNAMNYLYRHGVERQKIYQSRKFPYKIIKVDFSNNKNNLF